MITATSLFGQLAALADATRSRMLLLLEQQPLSVSELCSVMQLPQSTASRHLKVLVAESWASARSEGASRVYRLARLPASARRIWDTVRAEVADTPAAQQDGQRLSAVLEARREKSAAFFSAAASEWDRMRLELFGANAELLPLLALLDRDWVVGDLGCGTGHVARTLAPFVKTVIGVDSSPAMLDAARARSPETIEFRKGELEALPIMAAELDVALLFLVLHYVVEPARVLKETARALKPGGRILVLDMMPHEREGMSETMGHLWLGFSAEQMNEWLHTTGFDRIQHVALPVDARAKGPALFATRATRSET